jgi:hypothetical protein
MYAPGENAGTAGTQGYVYLTVIQRGNAIGFLTTTSDSGAVSASPADPGPAWTLKEAQSLSGLLSTTYQSTK